MSNSLRQRDYNESAFAAHLVDKGTLSKASLDRATRASQTSGAELYRTIPELGILPEEETYRALAECLRLPFVELLDIDASLVESLGLDIEFLTRCEIVPVRETSDSSVLFASADPNGNDALSSLAFHLGLDTQPAICARSTIRQFLSDSGKRQDQAELIDETGDQERLRVLANEGPIIALTNDLLTQAVSERASDIHVEALDNAGRVRFRVDGALRVARHLSREEAAMLTSRLKVMANLNISEKRRPQDGRAQVTVFGRDIDLRLSTLPTQFGESAVTRILDQQAVNLDWDSLGFSEDIRRDVCRVLRQSNGIFLVAGPVGSGKTTTLYTALSELSSDDNKIITVEDPIEYSLRGVTQVQVHPEIGLDFSSTLRAILRHDPNIILVGEIRDRETAEVAARAALVGRLVLSTVHTNDSLSAIDRLLDLGIPNYLLATTLRGVLSQRLLPRICSTCSGAGCTDCDNSGRRGRAVVTELLPIPKECSHELANIRSSSEISDASILRRFKTLSQSAHELVAKGIVSEHEASLLGSM